MFESYRPTWQITKITNLTPEILAQNNIQTILTDLDNTIIAWNQPYGTWELRQWLKTMNEAGTKVIIISNNNFDRVKIAAEELNIPFIAKAKKPFTRGIRKALELYNLNPATTVMVGDQLMTDIKAASTAGLRSILVKPLVETDSWKTWFNRTREKYVKKVLNKKEPLNWEENIR